MDELDRIRGVIFGQLVGDALGARYEFRSRKKVSPMIKKDRREDSFLPMIGRRDPGQITDDSEMALALMESLLEKKGFDQADVAKNYVRWCECHPPDIGRTTTKALKGNQGFLKEDNKTELLNNVLKNVRDQNSASLSNGSLMRQSPLGIAFRNDPNLLDFVESDTRLTHIHQTAIDASCIYSLAIAGLIKAKSPEDLLEELVNHPISVRNPLIHEFLTSARTHPTPVKLSDGSTTSGDYHYIGYLGVAFQGAFYQLLHSTSFEKGLEETILRGGDTDTNGCIAAALLGARFGATAIPQEWIDTVKSAEPKHPSLEFLHLDKIEEKIKALASL